MAKENLSGGLISEILDTFLYRALEPIVQHCQIFDNQLIYLLALLTRNRKRKITSLKRTEAISLLCCALVEKNAAKKIEYIRKIRIERSFIRNFIGKVLHSMRDFNELYAEWLVDNNIVAYNKLLVLSSNIGAKSIDSLFFIFRNSTEFLRLMIEYRNSIVSEYMRFMYKQASAYCKNTNHNYDFYDVSQNFLAAVVRAIDKYDSDKGALTSYINWWILNSQTCNTDQHEYGIAYSLPSQQKKEIARKNVSNVNNFSVSLDSFADLDEDSCSLLDFLTTSESVVENLLQQEKITRVQRLIKAVDPHGLARLFLDIDEVFTADELALMQKQMDVEMCGSDVADIFGACK